MFDTMERRVVVALFVVCVCHLVYAQVGSLCRPKERLLQCGCPKTCKDPAPNCAGVCRPGCYCDEGEVRNDEGNCVKLADCPPIKSAFTQDTSEPRPNMGKCPDNEEYRFCEPCAKSCENPNPMCPAQCMRGCFCVEGLLRDATGFCVKPDKCRNSTKTQPIEYQMTCNSHQIYKKCETCEKTCSNPNPKCPTECKTGCFCEEGYVKGPDGHCVKLENCPKATKTQPIEYQMTCNSHQIYKKCETCEKTCSNPNPKCPTECKTGCFCEEGYVKGPDGHCVKLENCPKATKTQPIEYQMTCNSHQIYKKCETCEKTCSNPNPKCPTECKTGCFCEEGYVKGPDGHCVKLENCPKATKTQPIEYQMTCNSHQIYKKCETCEKTCSDPKPKCPTECKTGCFCEEGYVKGPDGHCVKLENCPKATKTQPIEYQMTCNSHQIYKKCETCEKTCSDPKPKCPTECKTGCFCEEGYVKGPDGHCVKLENCPKATKTQPIEYQMTCNSHQIYKKCETCEKTCSNPNPKCPTECKTGCFCEEGYVKGPDGHCVKLENCPKAEMMFGIPASPSVEDCAPDEEYFSCGWCEPSCSEPKPSCPNKVCTTGCLCRPPLLRHHSGNCVEEKQCTPQSCKQPNEEYTCRYGCELRCETRRRRFYCALRPHRCALGCHCKLGYYRDTLTGQCVTKEQCTNVTATDLPESKNILFSVFSYIEPDVPENSTFKIAVA